MRARYLLHLTEAEHNELAALLSRAQDDLKDAARIVQRAAFTDETLRCQKRVQESLINPLSDAFDQQNDARGFSPYTRVHYSVRR